MLGVFAFVSFGVRETLGTAGGTKKRRDAKKRRFQILFEIFSVRGGHDDISRAPRRDAPSRWCDIASSLDRLNASNDRECSTPA